MSTLAAFVDAVPFPVIGACNMDLSAEPSLAGIQKWAVFDLPAGKVALLGYIAEDTAGLSSTGGVTFSDPVSPPSAPRFPALSTALWHSSSWWHHASPQLLRHVQRTAVPACFEEFMASPDSEGVVVVGLLSHAGLRVDEEVAALVPGAKFVVSAHSHTPMFPGLLGECLELADGTCACAPLCRHPANGNIAHSCTVLAHSTVLTQSFRLLHADVGMPASGHDTAARCCAYHTKGIRIPLARPHQNP